MGWGKYYEDNYLINDERMRDKGLGEHARWCMPSYALTNGFAQKTNFKKRKEHSHATQYFCKFCLSCFDDHEKLVAHIEEYHPSSFFRLIINGYFRNADDSIQPVKSINRLVVQLPEARDFQIELNIGNVILKKNLSVQQFDVLAYLRKQNIRLSPISKVDITLQYKNICSQFHVKQLFEVSDISVQQILSGAITKQMFDERIEDNELDLCALDVYLKLSIVEQDNDIIPLIVEQACERELFCEKSLNLALLAALSLKSKTLKLPRTVSKEARDSLMLISSSLIDILNGNYRNVQAQLETYRTIKDNNLLGCWIILGFLCGDKLQAAGIDQYYPDGIIGDIVKTIQYILGNNNELQEEYQKSVDELQLIQHYPVIAEMIKAARNVDRGKVPNITDYSYISRLLQIRNAEQTATEKLAKEFSDSILLNNNIAVIPLGKLIRIGASCFIISCRGYNIMLDCGSAPNTENSQLQEALQAWQSSIDVILISHAHLDHSGALPIAHSIWPKAKIFCTGITKVFLRYMLGDMARIQANELIDVEADQMIFTKEEFEQTLSAVEMLQFNVWNKLTDNIRFKFRTAGHIPGAAMIELMVQGHRILYTGDLTTRAQLLAGKADFYGLIGNRVDLMICEATYACNNTNDSVVNERLQLRTAIIEKIMSGSSVLLPASSIGRTQELICMLGKMKLEGVIPQKTPLYLAGISIATSLQISLLCNDGYRKCLREFKFLDRDIMPSKGSITIASSGTMNRCSASGKIFRAWKENAAESGNGIFMASDYDGDSNLSLDIQSYPLKTHISGEEILQLVQSIKPGRLLLTHWGKSNDLERQQFKTSAGSI